MTHIIRKQVVDLQLDKTLDAFRIQNIVSEHYRNDFLPALAKLFDGISTLEELIYIEKIEVDLGVFPNSDIEKKKWQDTCLREIAEQLRSFSLARAASGSASEPGSFAVYRQWIYYMEHGYLPWNASKIDAQWFDQVLEAIAVNFDFASELKLMISSNPALLSRIIAQHSRRYLWKLVNILTASKHSQLAQVVDELHHSFKESHGAKGDRKVSRVSKDEVWKLILYVAAAGETNMTIEEITDSAKALHISVLTQVKKHTVSIKRESETTDGVIGDVSAGHPEQLSHHEELISETAGIEPDGIFVENAGVVLLHPFLSALFSRLNLVREKRFINERAQKKAIYLVNFLATGKKVAEEYSLVIPKLLCAYTADRPIEKRIKLSRKELEEAERLLQAAIAQWEVLKTTSPGGLREGFLQRKGKLFIENRKMYLQVETTAIDVLLDRLPWNLSMIKLPWMKEMLRVEWR